MGILMATAALWPVVIDGIWEILMATAVLGQSFSGILVATAVVWHGLCKKKQQRCKSVGTQTEGHAAIGIHEVYTTPYGERAHVDRRCVHLKEKAVRTRLVCKTCHHATPRVAKG